MQQAFAIESKRTPTDSNELIRPESVHKTFSFALDEEANSTRIVTLFETWVEFVKIKAISSFEKFKRPDAFKAKYDAAKKEVEAKATGPAVHSTASSRPLRPWDDGYYKDRWLIEDHMGRRSNLD